MPKKTTYIFLLPVIVIFIVYLPAFVTEFGMHNDYGLLPGNFRDHKIFLEAPDLYIVGRALGGLLNILQGWCVNWIRDFALWRFGAFLMGLGFYFLFTRFLERRLGVERFWSRVLALSIVMLPASEGFVLWLTVFFAGYLTILLGFSSYLLLDSAWSREGPPRPLKKMLRIFFLLISMILFLAALLIYPPNAMVVFVGTFAVMSFSPANNIRLLRNLMLRDILFYCIGMLCYFVINLFLIIPHRPAWVGDFSITSETYSFSVVSNLASKVPLAVKTFWVATGGIWDSILGNIGGIITVVIISGCCIILYVRRSSLAKEVGGLKGNVYSIVARISFGFALFLLANLPAFLAKECRVLIGYRVLFSLGAMILIWQWDLLRKCEKILFEPKAKAVIRNFALTLVAFNCVLAFRNVYDVSRNYNRELNFIREKVLSSDLKEVGHFLVVMLPEGQGNSLVGRKMSYEFGYMITQDFMARYMIDEILATKGLASIPVEVDIGDIVYVDPHTHVIDLNEASLVRPSMTGKAIALVTTSADPSRRVEVLRQKSVFFAFQEKMGQRLLPFWQVDLKTTPVPWLQIDFKEKPRVLSIFTFGVFFNPDRKLAGPVECRLQGSDDGRQWNNLNIAVIMRKGDDPNMRFYRVIRPALFRKYRFYLLQQTGPQPMRIYSIHMVLNI